MKLIDRHIFSEWLRVFALSLGATLGILLLFAMYDSLQDLLEYGASARQVVLYFLVLIPSFLPTLVPVALMISILFSLGQLHRNNETIALRSCGFSLFRMTRSLWIAGAVLSGVLFYLNAQLVPQSVEMSNRLHENIAFKSELRSREAKDVGLVFNLAFDNRSENRLWFINRYSVYNQRAFGVTVSLFNEDRQETRRLAADTGFYDSETGHWVLEKGRDSAFDLSTGEMVTSEAFDRKDMPAFTEDPNLMRALEKRPRDLSLLELRRVLNSEALRDSPMRNTYLVHYHSILANPFSCLIIVGIAVPFAVSGVRANPLVGVSKSMFLFILYYLSSSFFSLWGGQGTLTPELAAWMPNLLLGLVCVPLYRLVQ